MMEFDRKTSVRTNFLYFCARSITNGEVVYTPPEGDDILRELLINLLDFLNDDTKYEYDPLLKMAIGHYQFEAIHPFSDGNGRTGRILNTLILMNKDLLSYPILYMSKFINNSKDNYYHFLNGVSSRGDWKRWLQYMLAAVDETGSFTVRKIEAIFTQPYIKAIHLISEKIKSRNTARKYLDQLTNIQVLELKQIGNENVYINNDLVRILES